MFKTIVKHSLYTVFKILSIIGLIAIGFCLLAGVVPPQSISWFQFFALIAPAIIIYNILLLLYWISQLNRWAYISLIATFMGYSPATNLVNINFRNHVNRDSGITVMSYNVRSFTDKEYKSQLGDVVAPIRNVNPSIICFQEFSTFGGNTLQKISNGLPNTPNKRLHYTIKRGYNYGYGLAIYTRYPVIRTKNIEFEDSNNAAMWVDLKVKNDTVRVFNLHLQTTTIDNTERLLLSDKAIVTSINHNMINKLEFIGSKVLKNSAIRGKQADIIAKEIENTPHSVIVCGDFNDVPNSYAVEKIKGKLNDAFVESGIGYGHTFKDFFSLLRIDFIFASDDISIVNYNLGESTTSDHHPIITEIKFK